MSHGPRPREDEAGARKLAELAALADGSLAPERRAALQAEIAASPELARRFAEQQRAVQLARSAAAGVAAPAGLRARIEAQRDGNRRSRSPRRLVAIGACAAVVAVAVAVGVVSLRSGTSAHGFHAVLAATGLEPGARGEATLARTSSGWRIELRATGLPRLADGRFYEAWLRDAGGVLVPVGTFNEAAPRYVTLWAGVSPKAFTTLVVTRERADSDQASSGREVLVGPISPRG
jgi:hypothetical protein